jgi:hypothetical protein
MGSVELVNGVGDMGEEGFMMRGGFGLWAEEVWLICDL